MPMTKGEVQQQQKTTENRYVAQQQQQQWEKKRAAEGNICTIFVFTYLFYVGVNRPLHLLFATPHFPHSQRPLLKRRDRFSI